jgi:hypothetical protein
MATDIILDTDHIAVKGKMVLTTVNGDDGDLWVQDANGTPTIHLGGYDARLELGAEGSNDGDIWIQDKQGIRTIHLGGNDARLSLGAEGADDGDIFILNKEGTQTIHLDGNDAGLTLGAEGADGDIYVHDNDGNETIHVGGNDARIRLGHKGGNDGDIFIHDKQGNETIHLGGNDARLALGGGGEDADADLILRDQDGTPRILISAGRVNATDDTVAYINGSGGIRAVSLELDLQGSGGTLTPSSDGVKVANNLEVNEFLQVGGVAQFAGEPSGPGELFIGDGDGQLSVQIDGKEGSIHFGNGEAPLLYALESDSSQPDRAIVAHSPDQEKRGLFYQSGPAKMVFQDDGASVLTVDLDQGNVGIGTDAPNSSYKLDVKGQIQSAGHSTASDARCKEDVQAILDAPAKIARLRGVDFRWKEEACGEMDLPPGRHLGLIAQETDDVLPEVVSQGDDGYYAVAYEQVIPVLVEAFKAQQQTVAALREENAAIKDALQEAEARAQRLESLEDRLAQLERTREVERA